MSVVDPDNAANSNTDDSGKRLSYKFQRLRERIRDAIQSGEFAGKLPGERVLARRFKVNAKTLSKALTELAAEGVLHRNVGLGTFVKGTEPASQNQQILFLIDSDQADCPVVRRILDDPRMQITIHTDMNAVSPSLLSSYRWTIIHSKTLSEDLIRDLSIRGNNILMLGRQISLYSVNTLHYDNTGAAVEMVRKLSHQGHRKIVLVDCKQPTQLFDEVKKALRHEVELDFCSKKDVSAKIKSGSTAVICHGHHVGEKVINNLKQSGLSVPQDVSVASVGVNCQGTQITGYHIQPEDAILAMEHIMKDTRPTRPARIWLTGQYHVFETTRPIL